MLRVMLGAVIFPTARKKCSAGSAGSGSARRWRRWKKEGYRAVSVKTGPRTGLEYHTTPTLSFALAAANSRLSCVMKVAEISAGQTASHS